MNDITLLYYTSNRVEERFGQNVRNHLLSLFPDGVQIVSISHELMDFGENIHVPGLIPSICNIYKQILIGAKVAKTKYIACVEDDALYNEDHFKYRPSEDIFAYNTNRWQVNPNLFFYRERVNMCMCIASTDLMIKTLELRFEKYPESEMGEPGKTEQQFDLPQVKMETFCTKIPTLTFNHRPSIGGVRKLMSKDILRNELPDWGIASELWHKMYSGDGIINA